ncbi:E3 ubiquitin-protein ligase COP1 [Aplysia californica]|uniref:E3 ubiquitin-protein ligase COP1 n=1 Tax=Aplysia californica TaxID=6500 RepID=A0ABM0JEI3_APLCA|nr:E3 ubiquitin-protein ligase COP1 [Aplysia californica]XP_005091899.1 E3 ubiquitin-protein ligase COP1 [Aplysia californica]XP_005091900.1 E3 ubiquitin-protein ligase COP1 [Aplysia californica]XP_005091901.1 E3 ubiquitin-protein ligase COP1 [Aplysia californica]XP_005091902.1 E3 ubiquitin-protein ligase COP1 [Aplysia californica]XP_005091903.1 E3 ubiquitin-protein ligase COP1 [Aplysia californica]
MMSRTPQPLTRRPRKRPATPVYGGQDGSYKSINNDFICPICFDCIDEAYMTKCGHSFCHDCIKKSLEKNNRCPRCGIPIESPSHIFPNFTLTELIRKHRLDEQRNAMDKQLSVHEWQFLSQDWDLGEINNVMTLLVQRKQRLEQGSKVAETRMLKTFLEEVRDRKEKELDKVKRQLELLHQDCQAVGETLREHEEKQLACPDHLVPNTSGLSSLSVASTSSSSGIDAGSGGVSAGVSGSSSVAAHDVTDAEGGSGSPASESFAGGSAARPSFEMTEARKKRKLSQHFEDLEKVYLSTRTSTGLGDGEGSLDQFAMCLSKFSQYTAIRAVASLNYTHEVFTNSSSIVSSIEFDRDCEYFAIAGVTKKIKVFEYGVVREAVVDLHYPITEMSCASKISCIAWNPYKKQLLSSADYDGIVYMWDTSTNQRIQMFQEHEKRCWSVDFNRMDPKLLASGSDDTKVKLWDWDRPHSVMTIEGGANVCCVKFNPTTRYNLAFGSADHCVHYYDLRNPKKAVSVFRGHGKAVSYVKFLNGQDMVSASTDSQLKLWSVGRHNAISTFQGHINEKNFVGLATDGDYIACGSENNSLYLYYKGLSKHILTYKFEPARRLIEKPGKDDDSSEFVSAVTWKPDSNILVAANSQGLVKLLELV